jgi:type II secretory pathway pseudopilin PulG
MKRRHAFTLVELMVSMALIIFMMAILSGAFVAALGVFRNLKGQGDLAERLRATMQILQRDLAADHFGSNRRLSDPTFWNNGPPQQGFFQIWHGPPAGTVIEGFDPSGIGSYRTINHSLAFTVKLVGNDMGDFMSASALGSGNIWDPSQVDPATGFPPKPVVPQLPGNPPPPAGPGPAYGLGIGAIQQFGPPESRYQPIIRRQSVSGYNYQWAEVAWFLQPQMNPTTLLQDYTVADPQAGSQPIPLYTLYRRQRLLVPDNNLVTLATLTPGTYGTPPGGGVPLTEGIPPISSQLYFLEMSCWPNTTALYFNSPSDITVPQRRFGYNPLATPIPTYPPSAFTPISVAAPGSPLSGSDIQLNNVVSFDVRILPLYDLATAVTLPPPQIIDPFVTLFQPPFSTVFNTAPYTYSAPPGTAGGMVFDTWSSVNDGQPLQNYSTWNTPGVPGVTIPFWTTTPLTYQYPAGAVIPGTVLPQTITTPITGSGPIIRALQVTIRIWDFKTNQTRQVTIVQAM